MAGLATFTVFHDVAISSTNVFPRVDPDRYCFLVRR